MCGSTPTSEQVASRSARLSYFGLTLISVITAWVIHPQPTAPRPCAARNPPLKRLFLTAAAGLRQVFRDFAPQKLAGTDFFSENMECPPDVASPTSCMARYLPPTPPHLPSYPPFRPAMPLLRCINTELDTRSVEFLPIGRPNASKNGDACAVRGVCAGAWGDAYGNARQEIRADRACDKPSPRGP
jgi:hypothetical protein